MCGAKAEPVLTADVAADGKRVPASPSRATLPVLIELRLDRLRSPEKESSPTSASATSEPVATPNTSEVKLDALWLPISMLAFEPGFGAARLAGGNDAVEAGRQNDLAVLDGCAGRERARSRPCRRAAS